MIRIHIDHGPYHDDRGRRLPPYVRCWATCDLCKKVGETVYGDTDFDRGMARAKLGLEFIQRDRAMPHAMAKELCEECRTIRFEYTSGPDALGRYSFTIFWRTNFPHDEHGQMYPEDDPGPHVRTRAQCFFCDPKSHIDGYKQRGFTVIEVGKA